MITIPDSNVSLPGAAIPVVRTKYPNAWRGHYITVRLYSHIEVVRFARTQLELLGDWFALDGYTQTGAEFQRDHNVLNRENEARAALKFAAVWRLRRGTEINVGKCSGSSDEVLDPYGHKWPYRGGGYQAEFLDGPPPVIHAMREV